MSNGAVVNGAGFCHLCGRPLGEWSRRFEHPVWPAGVYLRVCDVCLAEKPRCPVCRLPGNTAGTCATCQAAGPICRGCGRRPNRRAVYFGQSGPYCAECAAGPRCHSCDLPVGRRGTTAGGRALCANCNATAVVDAAEATRIYRAAETVIREQLGLALKVPTGMTLVEQDELTAVLRDMGEEVGDDKTLGVYTRRGRRRGIYAVSGLPQLLLLQVAAHELAHAWQMETAPLLRDPLLREGFAEWVAYRVLLAVGESEAAERIVSRNDIYGQGARLLIDIERQQGTRGLLDWYRRAR